MFSDYIRAAHSIAKTQLARNPRTIKLNPAKQTQSWDC